MASLMDLQAAGSGDEEDHMDDYEEESEHESDREFIASDNEVEPLVRQNAMRTPTKTTKRKVILEDEDEEDEDTAPPAPKKTKKFSYKAKMHFLTYPKVNSNVTHKHVRDKIVDLCNKKFRAWNYDPETAGLIVAKEEHKDGTNHFHVFLKADKALNITSSEFWDMEWEDGTFPVERMEVSGEEIVLQGNKIHGNYGAVRSWQAAIKYTKKDGDFIQEGNINIAAKEAASKSKKGYAHEIAMKEGLIAAVEKVPDCLDRLPQMKQGKIFNKQV